MQKNVVVSNVSDASFAIGVAYGKQQQEDISDLISLKSFANTEFCPRFILDEISEKRLGYALEGNSVYIISTASDHYSRNELAMRNFMIASAAKENGAEWVVLVEPDLFFSAQDRGPRTQNHPQVSGVESLQKFAGQPWSADLYARLLKESGVDQVMTVHNHKPQIMKQIYERVFDDPPNASIQRFLNLDIAHLVANYILESGLARMQEQGKYVGFVAPDSGALSFVKTVQEYTGLKNSVLVNMEKIRLGQREVELNVSSNIEELQGRDVFVLDDMVRTGGTIAANIKLLFENEMTRPANLFFYCTHTYISPEGRENLNSPHLSQFITTNTIPNILNRDDQGRLRKKTVVLKIEQWIANALSHCLENQRNPDDIYNHSSVILAKKWYEIDMSSKNPRHKDHGIIQYEFGI